jgi:hypothetical protein
MEEKHFNDLVERVAERVPTAKEAIRREFQAALDSGQMLTLSREELRLLYDYRLWKRSSNAAGGVFHWKKPPDSILEPNGKEI